LPVLSDNLDKTPGSPKKQGYTKVSIYESIFEDKRQLNSSDLILDYLYSTFSSTFKGIQAMLEKRHAQDDILLVKDAISDLIDVLALRKEEEAQGTP
jgi:hypothetical protein